MENSLGAAAAASPPPQAPVHYYRLYLADPLGRILDVAEAFCVDDTAAIAAARAQLVRVPVVELWQRDRFVRRFDRAMARAA